jgi:hypothetical protein
LGHLQDLLKEQETRRKEWRTIRDKDTYNKKQLEEWSKKLEEVKPKRPLEFELAYAIAQIDENEGINLLCCASNASARCGSVPSRSARVTLDKRPNAFVNSSAISAWFKLHSPYRTYDQSPGLTLSSYRFYLNLGTTIAEL